MKIVVVNGKEYKIPKRYQDKRAVEKLIKKARHGKEVKKKQRPEELKIPLQLDHRTTVFVRESKFTSLKWVQYFDSEQDALKYVENYKKLKNETKSVSIPSNS